MKVCLVFPRFRYVTGDPPLGLAYIAGYNRQKADVFIIDTTFHPSLNYVRDELKRISPEIVGIYSDTIMYNDAVRVACIAREQDAFVVIGGPHASVMPMTFLGIANAVVVGEGELAMRNIINNFPVLKQKVPQLMTGYGMQNLDALPFPALDLLDMDKYLRSWYYLDSISPNLRGTNLVAGRSCPFQCHFCHDYKNLILTDGGLKEIGEVARSPDGYKVMDKDGQWVKVLRGFSHDFSGHLLSIKVAGFAPLRVTPDHTFCTDRGPIEAKDLVIGDKLYIPSCPSKKLRKINLQDLVPNIIKTKNGHKKNYYSKADRIGIGWRTKNSKKLTNNIKITEDLCELVGLYLAEGHVHFQKSRANSGILVWTVGKHETELCSHIENLIKTCLGIIPRKSETRTGTQIAVGNTVLATAFKNLLGKSADTKHIPPAWFYLPPKKLYALVRGYMAGDGAREQWGWAAGSVSPTLLFGLALILAKLDIPPRVYLTYKSKLGLIEGRKVHCKDYWRLRFPYLKAKLNGRSRQLWCPIVKINKEEFNGQVYNLQTETGTLCAPLFAQKNCQPGLRKIFGHQIRTRSPENVISEIKLLIAQYEIKTLFFHDDTFTLNRNWVFKLCTLIEKETPGLLWACNTRANTIDEELMSRMRQAGLRCIHLGIESGSQRILDEVYHKGITLKQVHDVCNIAKRNKVSVLGFFMLGAPGETLKEVEKTIKLARDLPIQEATFSITCPLPGTYLYETMAQEHRLSEDFADYNYYSRRPFDDGVLNFSKLKSLQRKALMTFYLQPRRWGYIWKHLTSLSGIRKALTKARRFL